MTEGGGGGKKDQAKTQTLQQNRKEAKRVLIQEGEGETKNSPEKKKWLGFSLGKGHLPRRKTCDSGKKGF